MSSPRMENLKVALKTEFENSHSALQGAIEMEDVRQASLEVARAKVCATLAMATAISMVAEAIDDRGSGKSPGALGAG